VTPDNDQPAPPPEGDPPRSAPPVEVLPPEEPPADDAAAAPAAEEPPRRAGFSAGALIGAAVLGAAIALAVGAAATVFFLPRDEGAPALAARLAAVELAVRDLSQPATPASPAPAPDTRALDDVASRVAKLEAAGAPPGPGTADATLSNRLAGLEGEVKALADTIGALGRRSDDATTAARDARAKSDNAAAAVTALAQKVGNPLTKSDLDGFDQRVAALDRSHKTLEAELAKSSAVSSAAAASGDRALRLAFAANALKAAVERGEPFASELAAVKALGADPAKLAPLEPFAASGVPSVGTLALKLAELAPSLRAPAGTPASAPGENFLQRLQVNAEKLVRMRPVGEAEGDAASGGVARAAGMAARDDLAGAVAELAKLPPSERAPAESWIKQAQARAAAIDASRRLAADALAGLGK
jgi:hypothetical protein